MAGCAMVRQGKAWRGVVQGLARHQWLGTGMARQCWSVAWHGEDFEADMVGFGTRGVVWLGTVWRGKDIKAWGMLRPGLARWGVVWPGVALETLREAKEQRSDQAQGLQAFLRAFLFALGLSRSFLYNGSRRSIWK